MRKAISIDGDKLYITNVTTEYITFTFSDRSKETLKTRKSDLQQVFEWYKGEMYFYARMGREASRIGRERQENLDKHNHFYSKEEIEAACKEDRFAYIDMEYSNNEYIRELGRISGIYKVSEYASDKFWSISRIITQIQKVLNALEAK